MSDKRNSQYIVGTADTPATLTASYVAGSQIEVANAHTLALDIAYTMGAAETGNSMELIVEFKNDADSTNWYQDTAGSVSSGTSTVSKLSYTFAATGSAGTYDYIQIQVPVYSHFARVSVKETGIAANGGSCTVIATTSKEQRG